MSIFIFETLVAIVVAGTLILCWALCKAAAKADTTRPPRLTFADETDELLARPGVQSIDIPDGCEYSISIRKVGKEWQSDIRWMQGPKTIIVIPGEGK